MAKFSIGKQENIRRAVLHVMVTQPTISVLRMQNELYRLGYKSVNGTALDHRFVSKMMRKVHSEANHYADRDTEGQRVVRMRERAEQLIERLFCIVFWRPDYILDHIYPPSVSEQISAAKTIAEIDFKLYASEKISGLFMKRAAEVQSRDWRERPMPQEYYDMVLVAFRKHGFPQEKLAAIAAEAAKIGEAAVPQRHETTTPQSVTTD